jgi:hypothetical protein
MASNDKENSGSQQGSVSEEEVATPPKGLKHKKRRPTVHVHEPTRAFNLVQQHELLSEFVDGEIYHEKGGKRVLQDPANLKSGILAFWDEVAENATQSPAFLSVNQKAIATTVRDFCENSVKGKRARMEAGDPHEPPYMETGKGDSDSDDILNDPKVTLPQSKKSRDLHPSTSAKPSAAGKATKEQPKKHSEAVLLLSWQIECLLFNHVTKVLEYERAANSAMSSAAAPLPAAASGAKRKLNPPAPLEDLTTVSLNGSTASSKKAFQDNSKSIRSGQMEKHYEAQALQADMNRDLVAAIKKPSIEDQTALATATATAYVTAIREGVLAAVTIWKAEPVKPKTYLSSMNSQKLIQSVSEIGPAFASATNLLEKLAEYGLDGAMIANMKDVEVREFLKSDAGLSDMLSNILIAKLASWRQQLI